MSDGTKTRRITKASRAIATAKDNPNILIGVSSPKTKEMNTLNMSAPPAAIEGMSRIIRKGKTVWEKPFLTGEANMSHTLANLEYHHFKYAGFRRPGDVHIHFFGTATLSIADGIVTEDGDEFEISAPAFGAPLRNRLKFLKPDYKPGGVKSL